MIIVYSQENTWAESYAKWCVAKRVQHTTTDAHYNLDSEHNHTTTLDKLVARPLQIVNVTTVSDNDLQTAEATIDGATLLVRVKQDKSLEYLTATDTIHVLDNFDYFDARKHIEADFHTMIADNEIEIPKTVFRQLLHYTLTHPDFSHLVYLMLGHVKLFEVHTPEYYLPNWYVFKHHEMVRMIILGTRPKKLKDILNYMNTDFDTLHERLLEATEARLTVIDWYRRGVIYGTHVRRKVLEERLSVLDLNQSEYIEHHLKDILVDVHTLEPIYFETIWQYLASHHITSKTELLLFAAYAQELHDKDTRKIANARAFNIQRHVHIKD